MATCVKFMPALLRSAQMARFRLIAVLWGIVLAPAWAQAGSQSGQWSHAENVALRYGALPLAIFALVGLVLFLVERKCRAATFEGQAHSLFSTRAVLFSGATLLVGLMVTTWFVSSMLRQDASIAQQRFQRQSDRLETVITQQFQNLLAPMRGVGGMAVAYGSVSRKQFRDWVATRGMASEFPGVHGIGMIDRVPRANLPTFLAQQRRDDAPDFDVRTTGNAADLFVIKYIEPLEQNRPARGFDVGSEAFRRSAAELSQRTGVPALTRGITLVQDSVKRPGFLYFLPIYSGGAIPLSPQAREQEFMGWVYTPIVLAEFMALPLASVQGLIDFSVLEGSSPSNTVHMYDSRFPDGVVPAGRDVGMHAGPLFRGIRVMRIGEQTFQLQTSSTPKFEASEDFNAPARVALAGSTLSVFLSAFVWLLLIWRVRAESMALNMTKKLDHLAMVARRTTNAVAIVDVGQGVTWINESFTRITGYEKQEVIGKKLMDILSSDAVDPDLLGFLSQKSTAGKFFGKVMRQQTKDGRGYWANLEIQPILNKAGQVTEFLALSTDVTGDVESKLALAREKERADGILLGANVGTWQFNVQTQEWLVSDQWAHMLGFTPGEVLGRVATVWAQQVHPDDLVRYTNSLAACLHGPDVGISNELRVRHKDGHWIWVLVRAKLLSTTANGAPEWVAGIQMDITESKRAEDRLRNMEAFLDRAGRVAAVGAWEFDLKSHGLIWSNQTCEIHGVEQGYTATMEQSLAFYPVQARAQLQAALDKAMTFGLGWDLILPFNNAAGESLWVRTVGDVEFDDSGPVRIAGAIQDITRSKLAQIEIEHNEALFRGAIGTLNEAFFVFDAQDRLVLCNAEFESLHSAFPGLIAPGASFEEILRTGAQGGMYRNAVGLLNELDEADDWLAERMRARSDGGYSGIQGLGNGKWLRVKERAMEDGHYVGFWLEITELQQAIESAEASAARLKETSATFQNVLDSAVDVAIITISLDHTITIFNKGAERMLGYGADEVVGHKTIKAFFDVNQFDVLRQSLAIDAERSIEDILADVSVNLHSDIWTLVRKDAKRIPVSILRSPMFDSQGEVTGYIAIIHDVSEQQKYEESLREAMLSAEQSSVAKSQFLANMSHEIRTPMNGILGMLKLLGNTSLSESQRDYAQKTERAAQSLLVLLNDILDFSKIEAGKLQLDPEPFQVDTLLEDLSLIYSANLGAKDLELVFDIDPEIPQYLVGDSHRLKQVFINLGGNAIKFTAQGTIVLQWRLLQRMDEYVSVQISVQDSGIGISAENQARIFEGFSQAEASTTRRYGGTGLGLAISQRLIGLMGAELTVQSTLGQGSTFSFNLTLPVAAKPLVPGIPTDKVGDISDSNAPPLVILVDDNAKALEANACAMRSLGWQVLTAASGEQALVVARAQVEKQQHLDAVFVDWKMPGMDGVETLRQIRQLYASQTLPALVMLSTQGRELLAQSPQGASDVPDVFLVKPITASMACEALQRAISGGHSSESATVQTRKLRLHGMRILVVEDNPINQQVAKELLTSEGATVTLADNGLIGVETLAAADSPFDVVLMDLQMPVMGGLDAARAIRSELGLIQLPLIAMTANAMASDRLACIEAGMNDHVGKPFDLTHLVNTLLHHTQWPESDVVEALPHADTVNMPIMVWPDWMDGSAALTRMGGNIDLLISTMQAFSQEAAQLPGQVRAMLQAGDVVAVQRALHTCKGLAATLGIADLTRIAKLAHEESVAQTPGDSGPSRTVFVKTLEELNACIAQRMPDVDAMVSELMANRAATSAECGLAAVHADVDLEQLGNLHALLIRDDMTALELHASLHLQGADALDAAMADLDFSVAAVECEKLIQNISAEKPP